jgi:hypothetical protein
MAVPSVGRTFKLDHYLEEYVEWPFSLLIFDSISLNASSPRWYPSCSYSPLDSRPGVRSRCGIVIGFYFKDNHLFILTLRTSSIGDPISTPQTPAPQDPNPSDEALFSMYLDRVIEEDKKMVESWKGDAEGMLTFVGLQTTSHTSAYNLEILDWSLFCRSRSIACSVCPGYSAELAGHLSFLSRTYLSTIFYPAEWVPTFHSFNLVRPHRALFSAFIERLGKWTLVFESCHQPVLRPIGDIATAVGTSL